MFKPLMVIAAISMVLWLAPASYPQEFVSKTGIKLSALVKLDKSTIMLGEATYLSFEIVNKSNQTFYSPDGGDYRNALGRPDSYSVKVVRNDGYVPFHPRVTMSFGGLVGMRAIPANGSWTTRLYLPHWVEFERPGTYEITVSRSVPINISGKFQSTESSGQAADVFLASAKTEIVVVPTNYDAMGKLINKWGSTMMDMDDPGTHEAESMLAYTKDVRTLIYFAEALERYSRKAASIEEKTRTRQIAWALSKFDDDFALFALNRTLKNDDDDVRLWIADALVASKHPEAPNALLQMQDDPYWFVRLKVLQKFGKVATDEATKLTKKFCEDPNDEVRKQAKMFLDERNRRSGK